MSAVEEICDNKKYRVYANINLDNIKSNMINTRMLVPKESKVLAVIKADAYGHGAVPIAKMLDKVTTEKGPVADFYGVAEIEEGLELRNAGITKPILILGLILPDDYETAINNDFRITMCSSMEAELLNLAAINVGKKAKVHLKVDTGMGRIGYLGSDADADDVKEISKLSNIEIEGLFTHFSMADEEDNSYTNVQIERYNSFLKKLEERGINIAIKHAAASAGIIDFPQYSMNMVRSGISTYGYYPSECVTKKNLELKPAMELKSRVTFIKRVSEGFTVGYGATYKAPGERIIATVPVGYADGYFRSLSNKGYVLINGVKANIVGRVCMDQFMVDATEVPGLKLWNEVTLFGEDNGNRISVEEISALAGSFNYEMTCAVSKRVPRIYYQDGKPVMVRKNV